MVFQSSPEWSNESSRCGSTSRTFVRSTFIPLQSPLDAQLEQSFEMVTSATAFLKFYRSSGVSIATTVQVRSPLPSVSLSTLAAYSSWWHEVCLQSCISVYGERRGCTDLVVKPAPASSQRSFLGGRSNRIIFF